MKKYLLFISLAIIFASCTSKQPKFELEVNIHNNASLLGKNFTITQLIDGATVYSDTVKIKKNNFLLNLPFQGPALLRVYVLESNLNRLLMASEEGRIVVNIDGEKAKISGTPLNDRLQAFFSASDSVSLLFKEINRENELLDKNVKTTSKMKEELRGRRNQLLTENTDRIIAFIKENVDNQVGEFFFMIHYITLIPEKQLELQSFATEKLKKEFNFN